MQQKITLKWQMNGPTDVVKLLCKGPAEKINERTNGEVSVELYGADELVPQFDIFPGVQSGRVDLGFTVSGYGASAALLLRSSVGELPFWPSGQAGCAFTKAVLDKYIRSDMEALGVTPLFYEINMADDFGVFTPPYTCDLWCNKIYTSLEHAKGARIVSEHKTANDALRLIGMEPIEKPFHEVGKLFANNEVDGALITSFGLMALGCKDDFKGCLRIGFQQSEDAFIFMNKKTYDSLPADIRNIIIDEFRTYWKAQDRHEMIVHSHALRDEMIKAGNLKMIDLTPSEQAFCNQQWEEKLEDAWVKRQVTAGFKDARAYLNDLKKIAADILTSGIPQWEGERDR